MSDLESRWISPADALAIMTRAYASAMEVDIAEARKRSQASIFRYLAAGHWPARAGAYHCEFRPVTGGGQKIDKVPNDENDERIIPKDYWQIIVKSGANMSANWHLGEFDLPPFEDDAGTYSGFAKNVEFDRSYLPEQSSTAVFRDEAEGTGDPGRTEKGFTLYMAEFDRRKQRGDTLPTLSEEAAALLAWFLNQHPGRQAPTTKTITNRIRIAYNAWRAAPEIK
ncbi:hypothetical protein [Aurantiacibacter marinus]|uniref:Uncharacterized protein n=1 Tax=Aurantiacibacter marinus TaxID=874156 RepID=A0A0H0XRE5_9SPHN|nr:hypothetical protein [Aurantiacibacter marinus]KLI64517.1 hypothetical protein AAV99_02725 [Aurantiacibacter marinus]